MDTLDLQTYGLVEINEIESKEIEGGVSLMMWLMCLGGASVLSKFEKGYGQEIF